MCVPFQTRRNVISEKTTANTMPNERSLEDLSFRTGPHQLVMIVLQFQPISFFSRDISLGLPQQPNQHFNLRPHRLGEVPNWLTSLLIVSRVFFCRRARSALRRILHSLQRRPILNRIHSHFLVTSWIEFRWPHDGFLPAGWLGGRRLRNVSMTHLHGPISRRFAAPRN